MLTMTFYRQTKIMAHQIKYLRPVTKKSLGTTDESLGTTNASLGTINESLGTTDESLGTTNESLGTVDEIVLSLFNQVFLSLLRPLKKFHLEKKYPMSHAPYQFQSLPGYFFLR